jgi:hypothetical protein
LRNRPQSSAAQSGAFSDDFGAVDARLALVIGAWPTLPETVKKSILAMIVGDDSSTV